MEEDENGGLFNIEVSSDEEDREEKVPRDFQSEEDFQRVRAEYKPKVEVGDVRIHLVIHKTKSKWRTHWSWCTNMLPAVENTATANRQSFQTGVSIDTARYWRTLLLQAIRGGLENHRGRFERRAHWRVQEVTWRLQNQMSSQGRQKFGHGIEVERGWTLKVKNKNLWRSFSHESSWTEVNKGVTHFFPCYRFPHVRI